MQIIDDKAIIRKMFDESYHHHPVFMYYNKKQYPVKVISLSEETVIIKTIRREDTESRILTVVDQGKLHIYTFEFKGAKDKFEVLHPIALEIVPAKYLLNKKNPERLYVTNIVNQTDMIKTLVSNNDTTNLIVQKFAEKIKEEIEHFEIFIHERIDVRLHLLNSFDKPIYIPDKTLPESVPSNYVPYDTYMQNVKYTKGIDKFISEITIPLKYRNLYTFGYISAQSKSPMNNDHLELMNQLAKNIKKSIISEGILHESAEACVILDVDSESVTFVHSNVKFFSKIFSLSRNIIFDLCSSAEEKITVRGSVRTIEATETHFKIKCQFLFELEEDSKKVIEFLKHHVPHFHIKNPDDILSL